MINNASWLKHNWGNVTADKLIGLFADYLTECEKIGMIPDKLSWIVYLNISRTTYYNWQQDKLNVWMTETEFSDRLNIIKKIESFLENSISQSMMNSAKPTGMIFYLKNAFNWADKQDAPEIKVAITGYAVPTLKDVTTAKSDKKSDKITED